MRFIVLGATAAALIGTAAFAQAPEFQQQPTDLMPLADANGDGKVSLEEYQAFAAQGWDLVSQGAEKVKLTDLDPPTQRAFSGITVGADGYVTRKMYADTAAVRFKLLDTDRNGSLSADEINGRTQPQQ